VPPTRKYQSEGGPGMVEVLDLLKGSDTPSDDQKRFLKAQLFFWLIGATDGHAKNFSIYLGPGGSFHLTPLYDIHTAQPSLDARQIERKQMKLAMAVGRNHHYRIAEINGRHFLQTGEEAGLPKSLVRAAIEEIADASGEALQKGESELPPGFPEDIHVSVKNAVLARLGALSMTEAA
jgi:serine/threonine-protein kinase HipA